jgi:hypothetical protein
LATSTSAGPIILLCALWQVLQSLLAIKASPLLLVYLLLLSVPILLTAGICSSGYVLLPPGLLLAALSALSLSCYLRWFIGPPHAAKLNLYLILQISFSLLRFLNL